MAIPKLHFVAVMDSGWGDYMCTIHANSHMIATVPAHSGALLSLSGFVATIISSETKDQLTMPVTQSPHSGQKQGGPVWARVSSRKSSRDEMDKIICGSGQVMEASSN